MASEFKTKLYNVRRNPALMQTMVLNALDESLNNADATQVYDIPDATIPFVYAIECGVMETTMSINEMEALGKKLYPKLALSNEELYLHMSDDDYIGRFGQPARTNWTFLLSFDEIIAKAVPVGDTGIKKLTIPRYTSFTGGGLIFTMQYSIDLKVMRHGGLTIEYVVDKVSPVETLSSNQVSWSMLTVDRRKVVALNIPVNQFEITTHTDTINPSVLFQTSYTYKNTFFYARAYISSDDGKEWNEVYTTHSDLVYDPMKLTVVFKVDGNKLKVSIPTIYSSTNMARNDIRIDIYTTNGAVDRDLGSLRTEQFSYKFNSIDDNVTYVSPLETFNLIQVLCRERVNGGSNAIDFDVLRNQIIDNTQGSVKLPITNARLDNSVTRRGYDLVSNIDNITNRQFLASRKLGKPQGVDIVSGAGVAMSQLRINMESISQSTHVANNGDRLTIKPSMLYKFNNGKVNIVPDSEISRLVNSNAETIAREVNGSRYVYSPFHNVLDATNENFETRPYYLDNPTIDQKIYVGENDTAMLQVGINQFNIERIPAGYRITVKLESDSQFKALSDSQVVLQIGYQPFGENRWASVNGVLKGLENGERVYYFDIETKYDIDFRNNLYTTNMSMFSDVQNNYSTPLNCNFDITVCVVNTVTPGYQANDLDDMVQHHLLPAQFMTVKRERLQTVLGYDMTKIWRRSRTVLGSESYRKWEHDVPWFYESTVYKRDENGDVIIKINPDGSLDYEIEHVQGDPVLDGEGNQVLLHRKGDVMLDSNKQPILVEPRKRLRELTILMVDGLFYFANDKVIQDYKVQIPMEFVGWLQTDINFLDSQLLEMAELFLYPTTTYGDTVVTVREGQKSTISVDQGMALNFYLKPSVYSNTTIRPSLIETGKTVLDDMFSQQTISISDIITRLENQVGDDVMAIEVSGIGGSNNFTIITVDDNAVRLSLRKKLVVQANQELTIEDDVQFNFLKHDVLQN